VVERFRIPCDRVPGCGVERHVRRRAQAMAGAVTTRLYDVWDLVVLLIEKESENATSEPAPIRSSCQPIVTQGQRPHR
jgi:hypothetical protein